MNDLVCCPKCHGTVSGPIDRTSKNEVPPKRIYAERWVISEKEPTRPSWINPAYVEWVEARLSEANTELAQADQARAEWKQESDRLRAALEEYGQHQ